jgi:predicted RNA-binding protein YlqC (UPF0109 family)
VSVEEAVTVLAQALVQEPGRVRAEEFEEDDGTVVVELTVAQADRGRVIGRHGRTAEALRTIVAALGRRQNEECELEILD